MYMPPAEQPPAEAHDSENVSASSPVFTLAVPGTSSAASLETAATCAEPPTLSFAIPGSSSALPQRAVAEGLAPGILQFKGEDAGVDDRAEDGAATTAIKISRAEVRLPA